MLKLEVIAIAQEMCSRDFFINLDKLANIQRSNFTAMRVNDPIIFRGDIVTKKKEETYEKSTSEVVKCFDCKKKCNRACTSEIW